MTSVLPGAVFNQHTIALGKTRSGKSSALRYLIEKRLDAGARVCIIDPKGDWWGLKSSADGKKAGYPVVIFGGEHADVPINDRAGAHVAELVATGNRPCVIDLGGWHVGERTRFFVDFAAALFRLSKAPILLVIDEVHNFCPQGKVLDVDAGKMLHWANRLASEGSGKGIILMAASQRPQKVHKDFVTSMETLLAFRVIHPLDRNAIKDWIDGCPDRERGREVLDSLATMPRGTCWAWSPEIDFGPKQVTFPMFSTYDSFAAPTAGLGEQKPLKGWAEVDLEEVKQRLSDVVKEAEANDPKKLRARIAELEREAAKKPDKSIADFADEQAAHRTKELVTAVEARDNSLVVIREALRSVNLRLAGAVGDSFRDLESVVVKQTPPRYAVPFIGVVPGHATPVYPKPNGEYKVTTHAPTDDAAIGKGERIILTACVQHVEGCTRKQLTILTGYKRSTRDAYIQRLEAKGLIVLESGVVRASAQGAKAMSGVEPLPVGKRLQEYWMGRLPLGEKACLEVVVHHWPRIVSRDAITDATGYQRSTRDAYLQRLSARKLITAGSGGVKASDLLFD